MFSSERQRFLAVIPLDAQGELRAGLTGEFFKPRRTRLMSPPPAAAESAYRSELLIN